MAESKENTAEAQKHLFEIINGSGTAFMVTRGTGDTLHGRPMANAQVKEGDRTIYFASHKSSAKVDELKADTHVYLGYTNASGSEWASINGRGRALNDRAKIKQLWSPIWKNWFDGPDDPNLILIEVTPEHGEYWDSGSKALSLVKFAYTAVTGSKTDEGDHAEVRL